MGRMMRRLLAVLALACLSGWASAQPRDGARVYAFGNSLVHHLDETTPRTNVPHWLAAMAETDGRALALDGRWGFLRNFATDLPPIDNWSFAGVPKAMNGGSFAAANFDTVLITPANFIQYQLPDVPYDGDNPDRETPLGASLEVVDFVQETAPGARIFVYEGWAEMQALLGGFPPDAEGLNRYQAHNAGDYHLWYLDLVDMLQQARSDADIALLPVASVLAGLLGEGGLLEDLPVEALYVDGAPHGTETTYLLAAMVTYAVAYEARPPSDWTPEGDIAQPVIDRLPDVSEAIWQAVQSPEGDEASLSDALPERDEIALPTGNFRPDGLPALGMGLNGLADWSTQHPFLDLMKTARDWTGHLPGQWGGYEGEALRAAGHVGPDGWPLSLPEGIEKLETLILTDQPPEAEHLRGDYVLTYEGKAEISLGGRARRIRYEEGRITFSYEPGDGSVGIALTSIDAADPIRDIHVVREDMRPLWEAGAIFNPDWIEKIRDLRSLRFMDWMVTNGSLISRWDDRPRVDDMTWTVWGVPLPVMIELANRIGADPWFNIPHLADDDYVRNFAEAVRDGLNPGLKAHVEFSNEVWNRVFPQADWAAQQAEARWGATDTGWAQFYAMRAAQVMNIWTDVFGDDADDRLVRVVSTHTGWPGMEENILTAPLAYLELGQMPQESFDAYAITGYFGYDLGGEAMARKVDRWLSRAEEAARDAGERQGLQRVALREYVRESQFDRAFASAALELERGSLRQLTDEVFPYHASAAGKAGLRLVMYEGGTHVVGHGARLEDERLTRFFVEFSYTPEMARLYDILLSGWVEAGGTLFNAFVDVSGPSKFGSWGSLRHLDDSNPRWDMLMVYNATAPADWAPRDPAAFANGITRIAGAGNQRLQGTSQADVMVGGTGDDTLVAAGGDDRLHGGEGDDMAVLPGTREDYSFRREGPRLVAEGDRGTVKMAGIETITFETAQDQPVSVSGL